MRRHRGRIDAVVTTSDDGFAVAEPVGVPDVSALSDRAERALVIAETRAVRHLESVPPTVRARMHPLPEAVLVEVPVRFEPRDVPARSAVGLVLHAVVREVPGGLWTARLPVIGLEVVARSEADLRERLPDEARTALRRMKLNTSLRGLAALARWSAAELRRITPMLPLDPADEGEDADAEGRRRLLMRVTDHVAGRTAQEVLHREALLGTLAEALSGDRSARRGDSVLLVGEPGAGKSALVEALALRRGEFGLADTVILATSGSRLVAGNSGFGMWQQQCLTIIRAASEARAVLWAGSLRELAEVGKGEHQVQGVAGFLRPYVARGAVCLIVEATPAQAASLAVEDPALVAAFRRIDVPEPTPAQVVDILAARAVPLLPSKGRPPSPSALAAVERLHRRFAPYTAAPGRAVRFLENLLRDRLARRSGVPPWMWERVGDGTEYDSPLEAPEVLAAFRRETGLPAFLLEPDLPLDPDAIEAWFGARVLGQPAAVRRVADVLASLRAGLQRPGRPPAGLLLVGPTGTGKTELAACLAEYVFGDRRRITRFDLGEFSDAGSVQRLIGGPGGEGLLTAAVRGRPFGVLLLDEFEKADPALADLLLQVLGDGRLTDAAGRTADFRNTVVVLTSNLGSDTFAAGAGGFGRRGADAEGAAADAHFAEAVRAAVRPELYNRFDAVIAFRPIGAAVAEGVAARELDRIAARDGLAGRGVSLKVDPAAVKGLAARGRDPIYGARPLKRLLEREVVAPLAEVLAALPVAGPRRVARVLPDGPDGRRVRVEVALPAPESGADAPGAPDRAARTELLRRVSDLRRRVERLHRSESGVEVANELFALERRLAKDAPPGSPASARRTRRKPDPRRPVDASAAAREAARLETQRAELQQLNDLLTRLPAEAVELEERLFLRHLADDGVSFGVPSTADRPAGTAASPRAPEGDATGATGPTGPTGGIGSPTAVPPDPPEVVTARLERETGLLLRGLRRRREARPHEVLLGLFGDDRAAVFRLAGLYEEAARIGGARVAVRALVAGTRSKDGGGDLAALHAKGIVVWRGTELLAIVSEGGVRLGKTSDAGDEERDEAPEPDRAAERKAAEAEAAPWAELSNRWRPLLADAADFLANPRDPAVGLLLHVRGQDAGMLWAEEAGVHAFFEGRTARGRCRVVVASEEPDDFTPPEGAARRGGIPVGGPALQRYDLAAGTFRRADDGPADADLSAAGMLAAAEHRLQRSLEAEFEP